MCCFTRNANFFIFFLIHAYSSQMHSCVPVAGLLSLRRMRYKLPAAEPVKKSNFLTFDITAVKPIQ
ncbi:hypothetical protein EDD80_10192 [Anseongella ginsenosidimutans]|uniref:Uncharacterized protein n=1 Tax=Anseongella ginsenosidimutans TaxID=496056 RepID=A0A4R3KWB5_9SPHI|nr:hypothetical protein EDD80_10192 [Anseongella ginsenosidimutans]